MTDPISATGTVVGLASLGIQISQGLVQYYSSWKSYSDDIRSTYERIADFERILLSLSNEIGRRNASADVINHVAVCISSCEGGIERLKKKLEKIHETARNVSSHETTQRQFQFQRQRLLYPFRESTLAKLREIVSELRDNLIMAATTLNINLATSSLERLDIISERTEDLLSEVSVVRETIVSISRQGDKIAQNGDDALYQRACEWLSPPNPYIEYTRALREHHSGTGSWFIDNDKQFQNWKMSNNSIYWMFGKPGCGKTVLCALIIRHLKAFFPSAQEGLVTFFFFNTNDKPKTKVDRLLRSLVLQVALQKLDGKRGLLDLYRKHSNGQEDPRRATLVEYLIRQICGIKLFLVLDALDECESLEDVLWLIKSVHGHGAVRLICASRNEDQLKEALQPLIDFKLDIDNVYARADLEKYIVETVDSDEDLCQWSSTIQEEIVASLTEGADGMFRWAALQLQQLRECYTLDGLRETLKSLPRGLERTYIRILSEIPKYNRGAIIRLCYWMIAAEVPLDLVAAAETIKLDIEAEQFYSDDRRLRNPRSILRLCPGLIISSRKDNDDPSAVECVAFSHSSVKEFLISAQLEAIELQEFHIPNAIASRLVAEACVAYLSHVSTSRSKESEDWYWLTFRNFPLLEYTRLFWDTHVRASQSETTSRLNDLVIGYLNSEMVHDISKLFNQNCLPPVRFPPVLLMAQFGLTENLRRSLRVGMDVNTTTPEDWTPLSVAVATQRLETVRLLLDHGASVLCNAGHHMSVYGLAIQMATGQIKSLDMSISQDIALTLRNRGCKIPPAEARNIWEEALDDTDATAVRELLKLDDEDLFVLANKRDPLLHWSVSQFFHHYNELVKEESSEFLRAECRRLAREKYQHLLDSSLIASIDHLDSQFRTPLLLVLQQAVSEGSTYKTEAVVGVCELLIELGANAGANVEGEDVNGWTPLHWAAAFMDEAIICTLLPVASSSLNEDNQTALHIAVLYENTSSSIEAILRHGVSPNNVDSYGMTALDYGLRDIEQRPDIVECLIRYGATMDAE